MSKILLLQNKLSKLNTEMRAVNDTADKETGQLSAEDQKKYDDMDSEYRSLESSLKRETELEARARQFVETEYQKAQQEEEGKSAKTDEEKRSAAFEQYLRGGKPSMTTEQRSMLQEHTESRAQSSATGSAGGYLIPAQYSDELIKYLKAHGGMMEAARLLSTSNGNIIYYPTGDDTANMGYIVGENQDVTPGSTDLGFGQVSISAYTYTSGFIKVPFTMLEDNNINLSGYTQEAIGVRLERIMNRHMTVGTGVNQPKGIIPASSVGITGASTAISFDNIIDLQHSVNRAYRKGAGVAFMFSDDTLKVLRKIKDNDGKYIWQPADARTGAPGTILGEKYIINDDMDSIGAGKEPLIFGDLNSYMIRQVNGSRIKRLEERFAEFDQVAFLGFMRFDGQLLNTAAVKKFKNAA
jgi:HK97 family phage major capsid protein